MADIDSNLPVFSRSTTDPIVVSATTSANVTANPIFVRLTDGTDDSLIDGSGNLNVILAANSGVDIGDVDVTSVIPGVGATNLGKAEDAAHVTGDTGVMGLAVQQTADAAFAGDGDYAPLQVNATGALKVEIIETVGGAGGTSAVDDSAFTVAVDSVTPAGFLADETTPDSVDEGDVGLGRMTLDRKQLMVMVDATTDANRLDIDASGNTRITWDGTAPPIGAGTEAAALRVTMATDSTGLLSVDDNGGSLTTDFSGQHVDDAAFTVATDTILGVGFLADETAPDSVDEGDIGIPRMTLDRKQLNVIVDASTDANRWGIDASGFGQVDIAAVSVTAVPISADSAANTESNPIFVQVVSGALSGIEVVDFDTTASVAEDASDNHDLAVTASSTLKVQCCLGSASGAQKIEIQAGPVAGLVTQAVQFTSSAHPNWVVDFKGLLEVDDASTGTLRIIRTNRDEDAMDVYSTIVATEIAD